MVSFSLVMEAYSLGSGEETLRGHLVVQGASYVDVDHEVGCRRIFGGDTLVDLCKTGLWSPIDGCDLSDDNILRRKAYAAPLLIISTHLLLTPLAHHPLVPAS